jgi:drug/metabolite transporter (DMT)-like permease
VPIAAARLCWAIDNNLTRKVSASDALFIAGSKGLVAGVVNVALALLLDFSTAPFVGAAIALLFLGEQASWQFWLAAALMALGVWLHLTERHAHEHTHEALEHSHRHVHDEHHQHAHDADWDGSEPHSHTHRHEPITHSHPHFPDIHHRHSH